MSIAHLHYKVDEPHYLDYAVRWAKGNAKRYKLLDDSKTPAVFPALGVGAFYSKLKTQADPYGYNFVFAGRYFMYVYLVFGAFFLFLWLFRIWGNNFLFLPWLLFLFDPMVFAYSMNIGSDLLSGVVVLAIMYTGWRYHTTARRKYGIWFSLFTGFGFVVKASMAYLAFLLPLIYIYTLFDRKTVRFGEEIKRIGFLIATVFLVINAFYFFRHSFFPFENLPELSAEMQHIKSKYNWLNGLPVPLPYDYLSGFDLLWQNAAIGGGFGNKNTLIGIRFLDRYYSVGPVHDYYLVVGAFKIPLLTQLLLLGALILGLAWVKRYRKIPGLFWFIVLPCIYFFLILSFRNPFQIGIRHILIFYPLLFVLIGYSLKYFLTNNPFLMKGLLLAHAVSVFSYWQNPVAYTNELIFPKKMAYKYLQDTSISISSNHPALVRFLSTHKEYSVAPKVPAPGKFAIEIELLTDPLNQYDYFWLYKNFEPEGVYEHGVYYFTITPEQLKEKGLDH